MNENQNQGIGPTIAAIGEAILTIGVLIYLGKHSLNFFQETFKGQDEIFAWLGLLTTSGGAVIWLLAFLYKSETNLKKSISLLMVVVSILGEFMTASFDMYMNTTGATWTPEDIRTMTYVIAGLGLLSALAAIGRVAGDQIGAAFTGIPIPAPSWWTRKAKEAPTKGDEFRD